MITRSDKWSLLAEPTPWKLLTTPSFQTFLICSFGHFSKKYSYMKNIPIYTDIIYHITKEVVSEKEKSNIGTWWISFLPSMCGRSNVCWISLDGYPKRIFDKKHLWPNFQPSHLTSLSFQVVLVILCSCQYWWPTHYNKQNKNYTSQ
jgi:hypothetical protein